MIPPVRVLLITGVLVTLAVFDGCAKQEMPPGHGPDASPPAVVELWPPYGAVIPDLDDDAYVRFDEPLGDPASIERTLVASPAWRYEIKAGRSDARIRPRDGWTPGVVYHFRIPAGVRDLIRNQTLRPIELLFSTGPPVTPTEVAGTVWDRETIRTIREARVLVIGADSIPYTAVTDTSGRFAIPSLPPGSYRAYGFRDQNRNLVLDREFEAHDSGRVELPLPTTRLALEMWLVPPDSTPPRLTSVEAVDSLRLRLEFDDPLDPEYPLDDASVAVSSQSGVTWPVQRFLIGQPEASLPDGTSGGSATDLDSAAVRVPEADTAEVAAQDAQAGPDARLRPQSFVTVELGAALRRGEYRVQATGLQNLRGLAGGGDTTFVYEPPPEPEAEPRTPAASPDSARIEPGSGADGDG